MSATNGFTDDLMLRYVLPENVTSLLLPSDDPDRTRMRSLLTSVYDPASLDIHSVDSVEVVHKEFQTAVHESIALHGSWDKTIPAMEQARATVEVPATPPVHWIDMSLETLVLAKVAPASRVLASVGAEEWAGAAGTTENENEFERTYHLHYTEPPPFDPSTPARTFRLRVSTLFFDRLDLVEALRRLDRARRAVDAASPQPDAYGGGMLASSAWLAVFPAPAPDASASQPTEQQVGALLATRGFVVAFEAAD